MPFKPKKGNTGKAWKLPRTVAFKSLNTREQFPGKKFAIKGANWLNATMKTNFSWPRRKQFARMNFQSALRFCRTAKRNALRKRDNDEAEQLGEIILWLVDWLKSIR